MTIRGSRCTERPLDEMISSWDGSGRCTGMVGWSSKGVRYLCPVDCTPLDILCNIGVEPYGLADQIEVGAVCYGSESCAGPTYRNNANLIDIMLSHKPVNKFLIMV